MKQNNANIYLIFILGIIIVIFAILKQIMTGNNDVEGMENKREEILTLDGFKVKRRKKSAIIKESMIENYKEGASIFSKINSLFSSITKGFKVVTDIFNMIKDFVFKIGKFFIWIGDIFVALFSYIECGFYRVIKLPQCMGWYLLEIIGHILYIPFGFFFWVTGTQKIEKQIWDMIEEIDCFCYTSTGYHLIHYSDTIIKNCYKCTIKPIPKFPF